MTVDLLMCVGAVFYGAATQSKQQPRPKECLREERKPETELKRVFEGFHSCTFCPTHLQYLQRQRPQKRSKKAEKTERDIQVSNLFISSCGAVTLSLENEHKIQIETQTLLYFDHL